MRVFNKQQEADELIKPLADQIARICMEHEIPFFLAFVVINDGKDEWTRSSVMTKDSLTLMRTKAAFDLGASEKEYHNEDQSI
jgi:hypothetical protein